MSTAGRDVLHWWHHLSYLIQAGLAHMRRAASRQANQPIRQRMHRSQLSAAATKMLFQQSSGVADYELSKSCQNDTHAKCNLLLI